MEKSVISFSGAAILFAFLLPAISFAQITIESPLSSQTFIDLLNKIIDFIYYICIFGIAPIMIIIAGFYFITAEGEPGKVETAKNIIKWTIIGMLVILCAKGLVKFLRENVFN